MLSNLCGAAESLDYGFNVHAIVKPDLTPVVKYRLAHGVELRGRIAAMYDENGDFTEEHRRSIAKRMDQAIHMKKTTKAAVSVEMGVSRAAVTQYCQTGSIALDKLARFCQITKASMDYIVFGTSPEIEASLTPMILDVLAKRREGMLAIEDGTKPRKK